MTHPRDMQDASIGNKPPCSNHVYTVLNNDLATGDASDHFVERLEQGQVIFCPCLHFHLLPNEQTLFNSALLDQRHKNLSRHPKQNQIGGAKHLDAGQNLALTNLLHRFYEHAHQWIQAFFPHYTNALEIGRTSFRPAEIRARHSSKRKDDSRLHVDAFPSSPTQGKRILRVFYNVNPYEQARIWHLGEPFDQVLERFKHTIPSYYSPLATILYRLSLTKTKRTAYDHAMLSLHDNMKLDEAYQQSVEKTKISFPANSAWFVFTDLVSHAALAGQFLLEQTFYLPVAKMNNPALSPYAKIHQAGLI